MTAHDQPSAFGHLLKCHRLARGLTQEALAARAGVSVRAISDLERGINRAPRGDTLRLLTKALALRTADRLALTAVTRRPDASSFALLLQGRSSAGEEQGRRASASIRRSVSGIDPQDALAALGSHLAGEGPRVLLVTGGAESGRSCLLRVVALGALGVGLRVVEGGCQRHGRQLYVPLLPAWKAYIEAQPPAELRADLRVCGWLARLLPELVGEGLDPLPIQDLPAAQERRVMGEAVARFLTNSAGPTGTLLLLYDLQWADPEALELCWSRARGAWAAGAAMDMDQAIACALEELDQEQARAGSPTLAL
jgi:transcriptional regulator with XRE-family HTH domain